MLEQIREGSKSVWAMAILGLVILSFVFAGVGSYVTSSTSTAAASVNGDDILKSSLERAYENERARMESQYGEAFAALASDTGYLTQFKRSILDKLIGEKLLDQQAQAMGLRISDAEVKKAILDMPEFQLGGQFNNDRYIALLRQAGFQPSDFRDYMRTEMTRQQLTRALIDSEFTLPQEASQAYQLFQQTRDGRYINVPSSVFSEEVQITEAQIASYYQANISNFDTDEKVSLDYVILKAADLTADIEVSEQELKDFYTQNQSSYLDEEQRRASHILIEFGDDESAALAQAEKVLAELNSGGEFSALAKQYSTDTFSAEQGGDLDWLVRGGMEPAFDDAAFALENIGDVSEIVKTEFGFHIIKLTGLKAEITTPFDQVREQLMLTVRKDKADEQYYELQQRAAELAFEMSDSLQDVANELDIPVQTSTLFSRNQPPAALNNPRVLAAAFSPELIEDGVNSDVLEITDGEMMLIRVAQHDPARTKAQAEVSEQIQSLLTQQQSQQAALDWANQLIEKMDADEDTTTMLKEKSLQWQMLDKQARFGTSVPQAVVSTLFTLATTAGQSLQATELQDGNVAIVQLSNVNQAEPAAAETLNSIAEQLNSGRAQADLVALVESLKSKADIKIYE